MSQISQQGEFVHLEFMSPCPLFLTERAHICRCRNLAVGTPRCCCMGIGRGSSPTGSKDYKERSCESVYRLSLQVWISPQPPCCQDSNLCSETGRGGPELISLSRGWGYADLHDGLPVITELVSFFLWQRNYTSNGPPNNRKDRIT